MAPKCIRHIAESLKQLDKLCNLTLIGVGLDDEGLVELANSLEENTSLSVLVRLHSPAIVALYFPGCCLWNMVPHAARLKI